jgi:hypothetical protein
VLFSYFKNFHIRYLQRSERFITILKLIFAGTFVIMAVVQLGVLIAFLSNQTESSVSALNAVVLVFLVLFIFLTLGFVGYAVFLLYKIKREKMNESERNVLIVDQAYLLKQKKAVWKVLYISVCLSVLFLIRLIVLAVHYRTRCVSNQILITFGYIFPEIVPLFIFLYILLSTKQSESKPSAESVIATLDNTVAVLDRPLLDEINSLGSFRDSETLNRQSVVQEPHNSYPVDDFDDGTTQKLNYSDIEEEDNQFMEEAEV